MGFPLPLTISITSYLARDSWKLIFLNKRTLEISKDDPFVWTSIYGDNSLKKAIRLGNLKWVKHLYYWGYEPFLNVMNYAARYGHLEIVQWLHENRTEGCTQYAMNWAAANGHLEIVQFLHQNRTEGCTQYAMNWAANNGHLEIVQFLHENRSEGYNTDAMEWATENGHLEVVEYLKTIKID